MAGAPVLLVVGIHREELPFGAAVAAQLDARRVDVLKIGEGLSGRRPRADERFRYDTLHRALYLQLLPHVQPRHRLLVDLHTGLDPDAPCADLYSRDIAVLAARLARAPPLAPAAPRLFALQPDDATVAPCAAAQTVIPADVWRNPRFLYVGLEMYVPDGGAVRAVDVDYARAVIEAISDDS